MKTLILLAAVAAIAVPGAAQAQSHRDRTQIQQDRRTVRANRQTVRSDHRVARADQNAARADRRVARADRTGQDMAATRRAALRQYHPAYVAPVRNWRYRPVPVGYRLQPQFYGSRYYITDYGAYHLRAPGRFLQWVRYGNDLLLVNIRTGRVLQVIHYRYW